MHSHKTTFHYCIAIIIFLLIPANICAMEPHNQLIATKIIPIPEHANHVVLLGNKQPQLFVATHENSTTTDISTGQLIHIRRGECIKLIPDSYKTKVLAIYHKNPKHHGAIDAVTFYDQEDYYGIIYDTQTEQQYVIPYLFSHNSQLQFTDLDNSIMSTSLLNCKTTLYNYLTDTWKKYKLLNQALAPYLYKIDTTSLTHHSTKKEVAFASSKNEIYVLDVITKSCLQKIALSDLPFDIEYSFNGSSLMFTTFSTALKFTATGEIIRPHHIVHIESGKHSQLDFFSSNPIAWHAHYPYVATTTAQTDSDKKQWRLEYRSIKKNKKIAEYFIPCAGYTKTGKLFFSNDNKFIAFVAGSECSIFDLPFEVIKKGFYPRGTEKKLILLHLILKNYLLPEIMQLLLQKTVKLTKL